MVSKLKKTLAGAAVALSMSSAQAFEPVWQLSPDMNALATGVSVFTGVNEINMSVNGSQPQGIFGAGFTYTGTSFAMDFDADLRSWDYLWFDAFVVNVSTSGFWWNQMVSEPLTASNHTWFWGGDQEFGDQQLDSYVTAVHGMDSISLSSESPTTFYVSLVLDTKSGGGDTILPSWGTFHVAVVPEPETYAMLLAGLGLMGFMARRRQRNLAAA